MTKVFTPPEAVTYLNLAGFHLPNVDALTARCRAGKVTAVKINQRVFRFRRVDLDAYILGTFGAGYVPSHEAVARAGLGGAS
jgi:hypothetical protein